MTEARIIAKCTTASDIVMYHKNPSLGIKFLRFLSYSSSPRAKKYRWIDILSTQNVQSIFERFNPNDLIEVFYNDNLDDDLFKDFFGWNTRLNEKHVIWMAQNNIPIHWCVVSMSEEIPLQFIQRMWRKPILHTSQVWNWQPLFVIKRNDITEETYRFISSKTFGQYERNKVFQIYKEKAKEKEEKEKAKEKEEKEELPFIIELKYLPPYCEKSSPPVFRHMDKHLIFDSVNDRNKERFGTLHL